MSQSGKTQCVLKILQSKNELINDCPDGGVFLFHSGPLQPGYSELQDKKLLNAFNSPLTRGHLEKLKNCIVILDDIGCGGDLTLKEVLDIFTHHKKITLLYLCHDLFHPSFKKCRASVQAYILTTSHKNLSTASFLSRELFPYMKSFLARCMSRLLEGQPYDYLLLNLQCTHDPRFRVQSGLFAPFHRRVLSSSDDGRHIREGLLLKDSHLVNNMPATGRNGNIVNNFAPSFSNRQLADQKLTNNNPTNNVNNLQSSHRATINGERRQSDILGNLPSANFGDDNDTGGGENGSDGRAQRAINYNERTQEPDEGGRDEMQIDEPNSLGESNISPMQNDDQIMSNRDDLPPLATVPPLQNNDIKMPTDDEMPRLSRMSVPSVRARLKERSVADTTPISPEVADTSRSRFTVDYGNDLSRYIEEPMSTQQIPGYISPSQLPRLQHRAMQNNDTRLPHFDGSARTPADGDNVMKNDTSSTDVGDMQVDWSDSSVNYYTFPHKRGRSSTSADSYSLPNKQNKMLDKQKSDSGLARNNERILPQAGTPNILQGQDQSSVGARSSSTDLANAQVNWTDSSMQDYVSPRASAGFNKPVPSPQDNWINRGGARGNNLQDTSFTLPPMSKLFSPLPQTGVKRKRVRETKKKFGKKRLLNPSKRRRYSSDDEHFWK